MSGRRCGKEWTVPRQEDSVQPSHRNQDSSSPTRTAVVLPTTPPIVSTSGHVGAPQRWDRPGAQTEAA
jgi:hypothetical protein